MTVNMQRMPLPWTAELYNKGVHLYCDDDLGTRIAYLGPFDMNMKPNTTQEMLALGHLLAAAPEMLVVLKAVQSFCNSINNTFDGLDEVIAKAEPKIKKEST